MKARIRLIGAMLVLPASLGLGLTISAPSYAVPDCAQGTHRVGTGAESYCAPDQNAPDAPVATTKPSAPPTQEPAPAVPTTAPTASAPATQAPVPSETAKATPTPTAPAATTPSTDETPAPVNVPEENVDEPVTGSVPGGDTVPVAPQGTNVFDGTIPNGTKPGSGTGSATTDVAPADQKPQEEVQVAAAEKPDNSWALYAAIATFALIIVIFVAAVKKLGSPFKRENWHF